MAQKELDIQIEPLFKVNGVEARGFDASWRVAVDNPPAAVSFVEWVRKN